MNKTIITSILTTLSTLAGINYPWFLFAIIWAGSGVFAIWLAYKYGLVGKPPIEIYLAVAVLGGFAYPVIIFSCWDEIKSKFKFQSPIKKNDEE